jgi:NADH:ubiquinone oxidoreductase subunit 6 (subunit J)
MSGKSQLAQTGVGGAIVIGGTVYTGYWLLFIALGLVLLGGAAVRFGFRKGRGVNEA